MKKTILISFLLIFAVLTACSSKSWVIEKSRISELPDVQNYVDKLQNNQTDYKGYKIFTISEGKKVVVISSGEHGQQLDLADVQISSKETAITVERGKEEAKEKNPYILVGIDKIQGAFYVFDQSGEEYEGSGYYQ